MKERYENHFQDVVKDSFTVLIDSISARQRREKMRSGFLDLFMTLLKDTNVLCTLHVGRIGKGKRAIRSDPKVHASHGCATEIYGYFTLGLR